MLNIVITAGGKGKRFFEAGYKKYKPLLPVGDKTMIEKVYENLRIKNSQVFISVNKKYRADFESLFSNKAKIIVDDIQNGAAGGVLVCRKYIDNKNPLVVAYCDQLVDFPMRDFINTNLDGRVVIFKSTLPNMSYAKIYRGFITEIAEKNQISDNITTGIYYSKHGCDFIKATEKMVGDDHRVNNEFYVSTVFNYFPKDRKIGAYKIRKEQMHILGTPNDYEKYLESLT